MTGILDFITEQNRRSDAKDFAANDLPQYMSNGDVNGALQAYAAKVDPSILPDVMKLMMQQQGLKSITGGGQAQPQQPSALAAFADGGNGDLQPSAQPPQQLPGAGQAQATQQPQQQSILSQLPAYVQASGGNVEQALKAMQAARSLSIPPGLGTIPEGQQYINGHIQTIPGASTPGQDQRNRDFADIYTPLKNMGGASAAKSQTDALQGVIDGLKSGTITTGEMPDRFALDSEGGASTVGKLLDPTFLTANNQVMKAVLPSSKALFGPRITQREVAMNVMANGLNPYATNEQNITNLTTLKKNLETAQKTTLDAGEYFDKNGTLAGYQGHISGLDPSATPLNPSGATNQPNPDLIMQLKKRGLIK